MDNGSLMFLGVSCGFAVLVNISQYLCIGRFFSVVPSDWTHKNSFSVLFGFICFNAPITVKMLRGAR